MRRLRRAGGEALRLLLELLPSDERSRQPHERDEDVTLVFADVEAYSAFVAETDDDAAVALLGVLDGLVEAALAGTPGSRVVKRLGDGLMIASDRPRDALRIATALVEGFSTEMRSRRWDLRLRAGVHRGTCRRLGEDYFGYHVNLAARVAESAAGGQALATADALEGLDLDDLGLRVRPAGTLTAKGVARGVELSRVEIAGEPLARRLRRSLG